MSNGNFKLNPMYVSLADTVLDTLRRCRAYMSDDVKFQYKLPPASLMVWIDQLRLSQIITNAIRYKYFLYAE